MRVRRKLAELLRIHNEKAAVAALRTLLTDSDDEVRELAFKSCAGRAEFRNAQEKALAEDSDWDVRIAAANALEGQKNPEVVKAWQMASTRDEDEDVRRRCAELLEHRLNKSLEATEKHLSAEIAQPPVHE